MPVPHHSSFFTGLLPNQHHQSTEGMDHIILMALQMPLPAEHKLAILPVSILSQIILWGQWLQVYIQSRCSFLLLNKQHRRNAQNLEQ